MAKYHLVILKRPYFEAILDGRKRIELRLTKTRRGPFGQVSVGDKLLLKESSGPVRAVAAVAKVKTIDNLTAQKILELKERYNDYIGGGEEIWRSKADSKFAVLIWLANVRAIRPVRINKRDWRGWVVLTEKEDFGLLKAGVIKVAQ